MATIITVHGTNATGPEEGPNWWQRGSEFEHDVREFVQADDGSKIDFKPLIWDGVNSEMSRRRAGTKLLREIHILEKQGNKYCLLGHSHGGSVIGHSVLESASRGGELKHLSRWITIATPFIRTRMKRLLFARMGVIGKSAYLAVVCFIIFSFQKEIANALNEPDISLYIYKVYNSVMHLGSIQGGQDYPPVLTAIYLFAFLPSFFLPLAALYGMNWLLLRRARKRYAPSTLRKAAERFGKSHLALYHMNDEAVEGLRAMGRLRLSIFDRRFAVGPLVLITAAALPTTFYVFGIEVGDISISSQISSFLLSPWYSYLLPTALSYFELFFLLLITVPIAIIVSAILSRSLDRFTSHQIRQLALGDDVSAETAIGSLEMPIWSSKRFSPLPDGLSCLLAAKANEAAAQSIEKFRDAISKLAFSASSGEDPKQLVTNYITWNELIHNIYFKIPAFRKLVCYAIGGVIRQAGQHVGKPSLGIDVVGLAVAMRV